MSENLTPLNFAATFGSHICRNLFFTGPKRRFAYTYEVANAIAPAPRLYARLLQAREGT